MCRGVVLVLVFFFSANLECDLLHSDIFFGGIRMGKEQSVFALALEKETSWVPDCAPVVTEVRLPIRGWFRRFSLA